MASKELILTIVVLTKLRRKRDLHLIRNLVAQVNNFWKRDQESLSFIVINTGKTDLSFGIPNLETLNISARFFTHGGARNAAARKTPARYVMFLSADVSLSQKYSQNLFQTIIRILEQNSDYAGMFIRQVAPESAPVETRIKHAFFYPDKNRVNEIKHPSAGNPIPFEEAFFSNAASVIRRRVLLENPFDPSLLIAEDLDWAISILRQDWKLFYLGEKGVIHAHDFHHFEEFRRMVDDGFSKREITRKHNLANFQYQGKYFFTAIKHMWNMKGVGTWRRVKKILSIVLQNILKTAGFLMGFYFFSKKWPKKLKGLISSTHHYAKLKI